MAVPPHIAIIGAGASGLMAAITALRRGARVTLLERQDRAGKKLLATGNGRCNLANAARSSDHYHGDDPAIVKNVLGQFSVDKTIAFFESLGIVTTVEEGRIYPRTGQASAVLDLLRAEAARLGADLRCDTPVRCVTHGGDVFTVRWPEGELKTDRVIVCAGGMAGPHLGGTRDGIALLEKLGHHAKPVFPALVPVQTSGKTGPRLKGVRAPARAVVMVDGKETAADTGEVQFTEYGLSGIAVMQVSIAAGRGLLKNKKVSIVLDMFPEWSAPRLEENIRNRCSRRSDSPLESLLVGLLHKKIIPVLLKECAMRDPTKTGGMISGEDIVNLARQLKHWTFPVTGTMSWKEAQVMAGGIDTREFDAETMESRIVNGLYAAGEVLDVTGDCGGYNLQWAWSSGFVAGMNAAQGRRDDATKGFI